MRVGDRVRVGPQAEYTFPVYQGREATVRDVRVFGTPRREWAQLEFASGRTTWLPTARLEPVEPAGRA